MTVEESVCHVWLIAPLPDEEWGSDLRLTAKLFALEDAARAVLGNCPPEFHLWHAKVTVSTRIDDYVLID